MGSKNSGRRLISGPLFYISPTPLLRGLHLQCVIESIEIIEESDSRQKLYDFTFIKILAQLIPKLIINSVGIAGHALSQAQCDFLFFREVSALFEIS